MAVNTTAHNIDGEKTWFSTSNERGTLEGNCNALVGKKNRTILFLFSVKLTYCLSSDQKEKLAMFTLPDLGVVGVNPLHDHFLFNVPLSVCKISVFKGPMLEISLLCSWRWSLRSLLNQGAVRSYQWSLVDHGVSGSALSQPAREWGCFLWTVTHDSALPVTLQFPLWPRLSLIRLFLYSDWCKTGLWSPAGSKHKTHDLIQGPQIQEKKKTFIHQVPWNLVFNGRI